MGLLATKTKLGKLVEPVSDAHVPLLRRRTALGRLVKAPNDVHLPTVLAKKASEVRPPKAAKGGLVVAGGLIGLTAGSAAVSALRQRGEGSEDDS